MVDSIKDKNFYKFSAFSQVRYNFSENMSNLRRGEKQILDNSAALGGDLGTTRSVSTIAFIR